MHSHTQLHRYYKIMRTQDAQLIADLTGLWTNLSRFYSMVLIPLLANASFKKLLKWNVRALCTFKHGDNYARIYQQN